MLWIQSSEYSSSKVEGWHLMLIKNISEYESQASDDRGSSTQTWNIGGTVRHHVCVLWSFQSVHLEKLSAVRCEWSRELSYEVRNALILPMTRKTI